MATYRFEILTKNDLEPEEVLRNLSNNKKILGIKSWKYLGGGDWIGYKPKDKKLKKTKVPRNIIGRKFP